MSGNDHGPVLPGATIGFLGGGQLGRMAGMAARSLGYDVHVLDPDPECPARAVASRTVTARYDDADAAADLASRCQVVTLEIEQIAAESMARVAALAPVRPGGAVLDRVRDRADQKAWLVSQGFPVGPYRTVETEQQLAAAVAALGASVAKTTRGGYDGRGQVRLASVGEVPAAWAALGGRRCVVEQFLDLSYELSVLVARRPSGDARAFPPSLNHHERGILTWSVTPAPVPPEMIGRATQLGLAIATALEVEGLLAVEMFVRRDGELCVNELAPRPHNTFHATERACLTSQFEQLVRAVCDLPLGATDVVAPAAILNLLGDRWRDATPPPFPAALEMPGVRVHLYGKREARPGRKMGHLSAVGSTPEEALALVLAAGGVLSAGAGVEGEVKRE